MKFCFDHINLTRNYCFCYILQIIKDMPKQSPFSDSHSGVHKQFAGITQNFKSYQKSPHQVNQRGLGGMQKGSILVFGYTKDVEFLFGGKKRLRTSSLNAYLSKL
jgi:hypothetical protein